MSFDVEPHRDLVRITLAGFFTPDDVERFVAARDAAHRQLRCGPNAHVTLVDMRAMQIQSQETVTAFQQVLADPRHTSRRLAFVVARSLARLQIKRAASEREAAYFTAVDEAEAWVTGK
ncbi:STAS/SEC14 domain-containing protein [Sphingomonas sp. LR60]|uniref:STAS/SEC14 domain-containing protein n=1 Tax=Sphingomonas sp. LR60 TaxID=3050233 RepID=UPI002FE3213D